MNDSHVIEARIRYLTSDAGGRLHDMFSGYRGQFFYGGQDYDGIQQFPDVTRVHPGDEVRAFIQLRRERWESVHRDKLFVGMTFQIREGARTVGSGVVTRVDVSPEEFVTCLDR